MTARVQPVGLYPTLGDHEQRIQGLEASGPASTSVKNIQAVVSAPTVPVAGSDLCLFFTSPDLSGWYVTNAQAYLFEAPASSDLEVDIFNGTAAVSMLSAPLVIAVGETCSPTALTAGLLTGTSLEECTRLEIYPFSTPDGSAKGLSVWVEFSQAPRV